MGTIRDKNRPKCDNSEFRRTTERGLLSMRGFSEMNNCCKSLNTTKYFCLHVVEFLEISKYIKIIQNVLGVYV